MQKLKRRRFLTDALALGGVLLGAAVVMRPQPFWSHFLEGQQKTTPDAPLARGSSFPSPASLPSVSSPPTGRPVETPPQTKAYPSDSDVHAPDVTEAYPSDFDVHAPYVTQAYPSDSDLHEPGPRVRQEPKKQSLLPLWMRLS